MGLWLKARPVQLPLCAAACCGVLSSCATTAHELAEVPRSPDGSIYVHETTTYWPFAFLGARKVLRCRESVGSRTACTRLRFVVSEQLTADDCHESAACRDAGRCTLSDNACVAGKAADCIASTGCTTNGHCSLADGVCKATSDDDCAASARCKRAGHCHFNGTYCHASTASDCAALCAESGLCQPKDDNCTAVRDEDCAASVACKSGGRCVAKGGVCVVPPTSQPKPR